MHVTVYEWKTAQLRPRDSVGVRHKRGILAIYLRSLGWEEFGESRAIGAAFVSVTVREHCLLFLPQVPMLIVFESHSRRRWCHGKEDVSTQQQKKKEDARLQVQDVD